MCIFRPTLVPAYIFALVLSMAQASAVTFKSYHQDSSGITVELNPGLLRIELVGAQTVHVVYTIGSTMPQNPLLAVVNQPASGPFNITETEGTLSLVSSFGRVELNKMTGTLEYFDAENHSLLSEVQNGGREVIPSTVGGLQTTRLIQRFVLDPTEAIYGLGQHSEGVMNWVGHAAHLQQENREIAVPVLVSSKGYGVFWNNPAITDVRISRSTDLHPVVEWNSEAGTSINYYFFFGPEIDQVISNYRDLTGAAPLFGRWVYGFWQCKQRYHSQEQLLDIVARYRNLHIPIDGIIQDWLWWYPNPWGSHQFAQDRYPDPLAMMQKLHEENVHMLISVWAKFDVDSENANELRAAGALYTKVIPYVYPPGKGQWYDPFSVSGRSIYWNQLEKQIFSKGIDGWWLDASEAELSGHWGEFRDYSTGAGPGALVYNAYPLMHSKSVYDGQRATNPGKRVCILTRSAYAGQQRNAAISWSGDITGNWDVFRKQIPNGINFSLSGIPYWNTDTGGFGGGKPTDPKYAELFTRWFQFSAFCPMFRVHGSATDDCVEPTRRDNPGKEVWQFPVETQRILVSYDKLRYHLLPYIYSTAWKVTHENSTMMRGLVMDFRNDPHACNVSDQYMFGPALLVNPVTKPLDSGRQTREVYLPSGTLWYNFWTGEKLEGGQLIEADAPIETMPLFVRAGSILPYGPEIQSAMEPEDPIELRVYRGANGRFNLYEDENDTYNYEHGVYAVIPLDWNDQTGTLTIGDRTGTFPGMLSSRTFHIVYVSPGHGAGLNCEPLPEGNVVYSGRAISVHAP